MPGGETVQFPAYDANGNVLQRIDGNNVTTNYLYSDAENKLTDIQYPATTTLNVHFGYDSYGRRSSMIDGTGSQSYTYGNHDELQSVTTTYTGLSAQVFSYAYYPNGSRQSLTTPAGIFTYQYDGAGRMTGLTNPFGEASSWAYQNNNWLSTQTLANGAPTSYAYNALGQRLELTNKNSTSAVLSQFTSMVHDAVGNRTSVTANLPNVPTFSGVTSYQYDTKNQLTQEQTTRNSGYTDTFGYDAAGNPTLFKGATKTYNANNQQTATGFTHDGNGNPTTYGGNSLSFDAENRLTAYGSVLTAGYTGDGLRAWKQTASGRTYFLYDGTLPTIEMDSSGNIAATNTFGANGLISRRASTTSTFYTFDPHGSVTQRLDSSGATLSTHQFTAHGAELTTASGEPFGYGAQWGYYTDRETGLQLLTYRYYDPSAGRFLTRDPISYNGGINVYAYVRNSPLSFVDPLGTDISGIVLEGSGLLGLGNGGAATGSVLIGINHHSGDTSNDCGCEQDKKSMGVAVSAGGFFGPLGHPIDNANGATGLAGGAALGGGGGVFFSNANSFKELEGPFNSLIIALGPLGIEIDNSGETWVVSVTGNIGPPGAGAAYLKTTTYLQAESKPRCVDRMKE